MSKSTQHMRFLFLVKRRDVRGRHCISKAENEDTCCQGNVIIVSRHHILLISERDDPPLVRIHMGASYSLNFKPLNSLPSSLKTVDCSPFALTSLSDVWFLSDSVLVTCNKFRWHVGMSYDNSTLLIFISESQRCIWETANVKLHLEFLSQVVPL